jgi:hypothetical protein
MPDSSCNDRKVCENNIRNPRVKICIWPALIKAGFLSLFVATELLANTLEEGAHSPSWPNGLIIIVIGQYHFEVPGSGGVRPF